MRSMLNKSNQPGGECWAESLSDGETVVEREEDLDTTSDSQQDAVEKEQGDCIKMAKDVIEGIPINQLSFVDDLLQATKSTVSTEKDMVSSPPPTLWGEG